MSSGLERDRPGQLLEHARAVLPPSALAVPLAVRAATAMTRVALERGVSDHLLAMLPGAEGGSMRARLLCLRVNAGDVGADATFLFDVLSEACHHQPYRSRVTVEEASLLIERVATVLDELSGARTSADLP